MKVIRFVKRVCGWLRSKIYQSSFRNIHKTSYLSYLVSVEQPDNLIMEELANISPGSIILNGRAKFIMKKWSGAATGLLVVTGNHMSVVGKHLKQVTDKVKDELDVNHKMDQDVVVDEDVWIGARVTLLAGSHVGRGCEVGSNTVIRGMIPPYSIVVGNPAKIIGFRFTPEEIVEHEKTLYEEKDRLPLEVLEKNYQKYFMNRVCDIKDYLKL